MSTVPGENSALTPALTPRAFLVRGLAAGLVAGLVAFLVAFGFGEPYVEDAIALEEAAAAAAPSAESAVDDADDHADEHADEDGMVEVSRENQKSWGLLTGTVAIGLALGGLAALAAAAVVGRLGLSARGSTALVALLGFVSIALVPFAKYPATPPAVGSGETIGGRTASYFALLAISVLAMIAAVVVTQRLRTRLETWNAATLAALGYVVVVGVAMWLLPSINELGGFPADTLWYFRRSSLLVLTALWATIGMVLVALVGRLVDRATAEAERRAFAASL